MSWLGRLLDRRASSDTSQVDQLMGVSVVDLRSDEERERERKARSSLSGEDEQLAERLVPLIRQADLQYSSDRTAYDATAAEIRQIGEDLCANGGSDRMSQVAYRVQALGGRIRDCELHWSGICGWMY